MKREVKQKAVHKSGAKQTAQSRMATSMSKTNVQKTAAAKEKHKYTQEENSALQMLSEPDVLFSYRSTDDKNVFAIIDAVRSGMSFTAFDRIVSSLNFTLSEWANYLQLSERTIQRNQKEMKAFQPIQSERIIELAMLYEYGVEVFEDKDNFNVWLNAKSIALGGRSPKELLDTKFGIGMVKDELGRIEHGVLA